MLLAEDPPKEAQSSCFEAVVGAAGGAAKCDEVVAAGAGAGVGALNASKPKKSVVGAACLGAGVGSDALRAACLSRELVRELERLSE